MRGQTWKSIVGVKYPKEPGRMSQHHRQTKSSAKMFHSGYGTSPKKKNPSCTGPKAGVERGDCGGNLRAMGTHWVTEGRGIRLRKRKWGWMKSLEKHMKSVKRYG